MKLCASKSELISRQKSLHRCINGQRQIRNTSDLYATRSTGHPYRTTTARSQSPGRSQETVCATKFPSSDNSQSKRCPRSKTSPTRMQLLLSLCWKAASQKLSCSKSLQSRFTQGQIKTFRVGGTSYVRRVDSDYQLGCVSCMHGT